MPIGSFIQGLLPTRPGYYYPALEPLLDQLELTERWSPRPRVPRLLSSLLSATLSLAPWVVSSAMRKYRADRVMDVMDS